MSLFLPADPATDQEIALVTNMEKEDTYAAIAAALEAQRQWKKIAPQARSELLKKWHAAIIENADDLALISSAECGKPLPAAKQEVADAAGFIDYSVHEMMCSSRVVVSPSLPSQKVMVTKEPVGVCGIVTSWNFPLAMITRKLGLCLAAGCTAVVKPSAKTPLSALALAKLAEEVGIPAGVVNVVPSSHDKAAEVGEALTTSSGVRKIVFTGSTQAGKLLMQQSAARAKRISLELSGNAPFIVFEDADVDKALDGLMASKFCPSVQTCVCTNRIFIHEDIYDEFATKLVERVRKLKVGLPCDAGVQVGPLISSTAFQRTSDLVDDAVKNGAKVLVGGKPDGHGKNFYEPTVLVNVGETMHVWSEEIIGPVIPLFEFPSEEEVLGMANEAKANLAGYFFSRNLARTWRVAAALECDAVGVNTSSIPNMQTRFGGVTQSGVDRGGSHLGLEEFQDTKVVFIGGLEE
ncbi:hypothetical protein BBJ28_00006096 [Nothophytophthora sp. Chile5]|nr:hypothetical protein BBJ28_00006096 [Nothophytophthora sp. Chile5]